MAAPQGVSIAFGSAAMSATPSWTRIDNRTDIKVTGWTIDRGRSYELDKTQPGSATIKFFDLSGTLDPTNSHSPAPFVTNIVPLAPAAIALQNPVTSAWSTLFTGFVESYEYELDVTEKFFTGTITLVDGMEILANAEVVPGTTGETVYNSQQVDDRIKAALADGSWPPANENIFSGNVAVQDTVYAPRAQLLQVIQDAADAEFPGVANFFMAKDGKATFHGRLARFDPTNVTYGLNAWTAGDATACASDTAKAPIATMSMSMDLAKILNSAMATPQNIADADIAGQLSTDTGSIATYGVRSWSAENLITLSGDETGTPTKEAETKKFSDYYKDNYAAARTRVSSLTFRPQPVAAHNGTALWALMCGVEISDTMAVTTTHPGGGGFSSEPFFVEGIHYEAGPLNASMHDVTLKLDLSPAQYFNTDPFS